MKKINLLAVLVAGVFAVACNGGSSSGGGSSNTSDACANGAATCGALSSAESVEKVIPLNALPVVGLTALTGTNEPIIKSTTNLYLSNQESAFVTFSVESNGVTQPFIMDFNIRAKFETTLLPKFVATTSAGQNANQCKFPANVNGSYVCTLTISPNNAPAGAYEIIGTIVNGNQPFEINVVTNYQEPTSFTLPLGTYSLKGTTIGYLPNATPPLCFLAPYIENLQYINTASGGYFCSKDGNNFRFCGTARAPMNETRLPTISLPSYFSNDIAFIDLPQKTSGYMTNVGWNNNIFSMNTRLDVPLCAGLEASSTWTFQSSSTTPPYPVVNQTTLKTKIADKTMTSLFGGFAQ